MSDPVPSPVKTPVLTDLAKAQLATLLRKAALVGATFALAHHVNSSTVDAISALFDWQSIASEIVGAAMIYLSARANKIQNTKVIMAAVTGVTSATPTTSDTVLLEKAGLVPGTPPVAVSSISIGGKTLLLLLGFGTALALSACRSLPGETTAPPLLAFTNSSAYLLGHPVSSNQLYVATVAATTIGAQLLVKEQPDAAKYYPDAKVVLQALANSGTYSAPLLQQAMNQIGLKDPSDQALVNNLGSTVLSLAGAYVGPLVTGDTNSGPFVKAALLGISDGL